MRMSQWQQWRGLSLVAGCVLLSRLVGGIAQDKPAVVNTQEETIPFTSPQDALKMMKAPEGFRIELFAHEPQVLQPISITTDERGRLWVAENNTYAESKVNFDTTQRDRIVILEDTDGDGKCDKRTVFWDQAEKLTSVEVGFGGVWALCAPNLLFIPDRDRDDKPDGPPIVVLDGWDGNAVRHNIVNGLRWGPDGWLYGRHGILATSLVGPPGASESQRDKINCGVWRYHPTKKTFEAVAHGTTNPWGFDFDQHGEMFLINTVIGHLWHVVPNAHFRRMYGTHFNPYLFGVMEQTADHFHWDTKEAWSDIRKLGVTDTTSAAGGGHAHSGFMIYQGDNWPEKYRGKAFTVNLHGHRLNCDRLERHDAGFVAKHDPDFLFTSDPWFRAVELISAADGGVYLADWSDIGECHENDGVHRTSGRIFKVVHGPAKKSEPINLATADDAQLVSMQTSKNDWFARQSRRILQERAADGRDMTGARAKLLELFTASNSSTVIRLRAMWCLASMDAFDETWLIQQLKHTEEYVRVWAVRLLSESNLDRLEATDALRIAQAFGELSQSEKSGIVQIHLASALKRFPAGPEVPLTGTKTDTNSLWMQRWLIAMGLTAKADFANDNMLPLLIWYGIEPSVTRQPAMAVSLAQRAKFPMLRQFIARRLTLDIEQHPQAVEALVAQAFLPSNAVIRPDFVRGMAEALRGWSRAPAPGNWSKLAAEIDKSGSDELKTAARELSVVFGDGRALAEVRKLITDGSADVASRQQALRALITSKPDDLVTLLLKLVDDRELMIEAIRGLATVDHPDTAKRVIGKWGQLSPDGRLVALSTLVSRPNSAKELLNAVAANQIPRRDVSAFHARQILSFNNDDLTKQLTTVWGEVRTSNAEKQKLTAQWKEKLTSTRMKDANLSNGRALFNKTCSNCHVLFGSGKSAGPDLTGGNRRNLDYLLENILDPSATVAADFRMTVFNMTDGRVINGVVVEKTEKTLTVQTQNDRVTIQRSDIEEQKTSTLSLMADGLFQNLTDEQVRDLIGYLMSPDQVALPSP